jgi:peroxiredoxin
MSSFEKVRTSQAEVASGMIAPEGKAPRPGYRLRDFTLPSSEPREISISDYRGRANLVLVFGGSFEQPARAWLQQLSDRVSAVREEDAQFLAVLDVSPTIAKRHKDTLGICFPILADMGGSVHREYGAIDAANCPAPALYIADKFGEIFLARWPDQNFVSDFDEILRTLQFINSQCPECEAPEWPLEEA